MSEKSRLPGLSTPTNGLKTVAIGTTAASGIFLIDRSEGVGYASLANAKDESLE